MDKKEKSIHISMGTIMGAIIASLTIFGVKQIISNASGVSVNKVEIDHNKESVIEIKSDVKYIRDNMIQKTKGM